MTAISDTSLFQSPTPPPARPVHRAQRQDFSEHIPTRANSEREQEGVHDLPASNQPGTPSATETPTPDARVSVPLHLQVSTASSTRVFEWGPRVNGYLSEVVASDHTVNADSHGLPTLTHSASGTVAEESGAIVPFGAAVDARTPAAQMSGASSRLEVPTDAAVNMTDESASPVLTAAGNEPFQRTLVRWVEASATPTLYIRNFRLSPDEARELAFTLTTAFGRTWPSSTRLVINGRAAHSHRCMPSQGASPCLSIP